MALQTYWSLCFPARTKRLESQKSHSVTPYTLVSQLTMAKGSQLTQLKAALSKAGLERKSRENRKRNVASRVAEHDKIKQAAKLREIQQKLNPFDVKVTKLKHDAGGRKIKGTIGRPAQSKQAGMQQVLVSSCVSVFSHICALIAREDVAERDGRKRTRRWSGRPAVW